MEDIADKFAKSALDAKEYGFDSVLLHFGHGWLPAEFLSPYFNKRTDEYGGSFENRYRFATDIVKAIKAPETIPGMICGTITLIKAIQGVHPKSIAASAKFGSRERILGITDNIT